MNRVSIKNEELAVNGLNLAMGSVALVGPEELFRVFDEADKDDNG
jgi:hypothetical protein